MPGRNRRSTTGAARKTDGPSRVKVKITLPTAWNLKPNPTVFTFQSTSDFNLSWNEFFEKYSKNAVYKTLKKQIGNGKEEFLLTDNRFGDKKLSWTLDTSIDQYIDSFTMTYKTYNATILNASKLPPTARRPQQVQSPTAPAASTGSSAARGNLGNATRETPKTTKRKANDNEARRADLSPPIRPRLEEDEEITIGEHEVPSSRINNHEEIPRPILPNIPILHDMRSMASITSQDSMSDLIAQGVDTNRDLLTRYTYNWTRNLDNATLLRIERELKQVKANGKWLQTCRHMPITANLLSVVFEL